LFKVIKKIVVTKIIVIMMIIIMVLNRVLQSRCQPAATTIMDFDAAETM
jgi:hypothetical protein